MNNNKRFDVVALGELLVDFTEYGLSDRGNMVYEANPGGAPCNVLALLQKLGKHTSFIGKVGNDPYGRMLERTVKSIGIDTHNLIFDSNIPTTLAIVSKNADGDREFSFYRNPGADMMLKTSDIDDQLLSDTKIFHFGTLSMTHKEVREATIYAVEKAKENGAVISLDPNLRELLWSSLEEAKLQMKAAMKYCDILKISDNELEFVTGEKDYDKAVEMLRHNYDITLICVTLGKDGSIAYYKDMIVRADGYKQDNVIETTGAGDTFCGCVLNYICDNDLYSLSEEQLKDMLQYANAGASIVTTRMGALLSMPEASEIEILMNNN